VTSANNENVVMTAHMIRTHEHHPISPPARL
jgi:hypothetical protein